MDELLVIAAAALAAGCVMAPAEGLRRSSPTRPTKPTLQTKRETYKKTPQGALAMHLHFPPGWKAEDKRPAIVLFFGGGWRAGSVQQFLKQAEYLARRGMVVARADYRVKLRHGTSPVECVEDGKSAVRWLRRHAAELGIDPKAKNIGIG